MFGNVSFPSGKIHMGHVEITQLEMLYRYKYLNNFNVYIPWVGTLLLPAENASKQIIFTPKNGQMKIKNDEKTVKNAWLIVDWGLEISTCDKSYYKHQQELFIDFFNNGLISRKEHN